MRRVAIVLGAVVALPILSATPSTLARTPSDWTNYGSASGDLGRGQSVTLTGNQRNQAGLTLQKSTTSLAKAVTFRYRLQHSGSANSADGSAFVLLNSRAPSPRSPRPKGGNLGIAGLDGIAVIFDTFRNRRPGGGDYVDPSSNYIAVVDMQRGFDQGWLLTPQTAVWQGQVKRNENMDVFITVDRANGIIEVGLAAAPNADALFAREPQQRYQFPLEAHVVTGHPEAQPLLTDTVRVGLAGASGTTRGVHRVVRYLKPIVHEVSPVNSGLNGALLSLNELANREGLQDCAPPQDFEGEDSGAQDPPPTSAGTPVTTLLQTTEQQRTVHIFKISCRDLDSRQAIPTACSGVIVSPDLVLTAAHCTSVAHHVTIGAVVTRGDSRWSNRLESSGGSCVARKLWAARGEDDAFVSGDLALLRLENCTRPEYLLELGGAEIDVTVAASRLEGAPAKYIGYPGDKWGSMGIPDGAWPDMFPEMWSINSTMGIAKSDEGLPDGVEEDVLKIGELVQGGGSGGPIYHDSRFRTDAAVMSVASMWSKPNSWDTWTIGPLITEDLCRQMWRVAIDNLLLAPRCVGDVPAPSMPGPVRASAGIRSALVEWEPASVDGGPDVRYKVKSFPDGQTCTTRLTSCIVGGLRGGTSYTFVVVAHGPFGESLPSFPSNAVVPGPVDDSSSVPVVSAGTGYTCAVTTRGGARCWGSNGYGKLGTPHVEWGMSTRPVDVTGLTSGVSSVVAGGDHTCAVTSSGGAKCWGSNSSGGLGDDTTVSAMTPVDVAGLSAGVLQISVGGNHTCALMQAGAVKCWGGNAHGQLGDGTTKDSWKPVAVAGLQADVAQIEAGDEHTCALMKSGSVKCWGYNYRGELGTGTTESQLTPAPVVGLDDVVELSTGGHHSCAIVSLGAVKCWGANWHGELGDGSTTHRSTPVEVAGLDSTVLSLAASRHHTCAVTVRGTVKCWGRNAQGQLGDGTMTDRLTPTDVMGLATPVVQVSSGSQHTCVAARNGGIKCWGHNWNGELGDGTTTARMTPVDVVDL